jgi:hypothetical protein
VLYVQAGLLSLDDYSTPKKWQTSSSGDWAQVPIDPKTAADVRDSRDLNRPFAVSGQLGDQTIEDVVATIRRSDPGVQGTWPIVWLGPDTDNRIRVLLVEPDRRELSGQAVFLSRSTSGWIVVSVAGWAT